MVGLDVGWCLLLPLKVTISGAGNFSAWEFGGFKAYYSVHEYFFGFGNAIFMVLFSLRDDYEKQLDSVSLCSKKWQQEVRFNSS